MPISAASVDSESCSNDPCAQFISEKSAAKTPPLECCHAGRLLNRCACLDIFNRPVPEYSSPFPQKAPELKSRQTFTYAAVMEREKKPRLLVKTDVAMLLMCYFLVCPLSFRNLKLSISLHYCPLSLEKNILTNLLGCATEFNK